MKPSARAQTPSSLSQDTSLTGSPSSGVHHRIADGRWRTTAAFGLSPEWYAAEARNVAAPGASGQLPPIRGLQTGVVKKVAGDPAGEHRVLVSLPLLQDTAKGVWARLGTLYASSKTGAVFFPEVGDEVGVAFMNEDPRGNGNKITLAKSGITLDSAPDIRINAKGSFTVREGVDR